MEKVPIAVFIHLSDLHFGEPLYAKKRFRGRKVLKNKYKKQKSFLTKLEQFRWLHPHNGWVLGSLSIDLHDKSKFPKIDSLFVTGDITTYGDSNSFENAYKYLTGKYCYEAYKPNELNLGIDNLFCIPGNHDTYNDKYNLKQNDRLTSYRSVFSKHNPPYLEPFEVKGQGGLTKKFAIIGLDTTRHEWNHFADGAIGEDQFLHLKHYVNRLKNENKFKNSYKIVLLHHHPFPIPGKTPSHWTQLFDASSLIPMLQDGNIDMILHGHEHVPFACIVQYPGLKGKKPLVICGAGTASQMESRYSFNAINFYEGYIKLTVWKYMDSMRTFQCRDRMKIKLFD